MSDTPPWPRYGQLDPSATQATTWAKKGEVVEGKPLSTRSSFSGGVDTPVLLSRTGETAPVPRTQGPKEVRKRRIGPLVALFSGIFTAVFLAPLVFVGVILATPGILEAARAQQEVANGSTVIIGESGAYFVSSITPDVQHCHLTGQDGVVHDMGPAPGPTGGFLIQGLPRGSYVLTCSGEGQMALTAGPFVSEEAVRIWGSRAFMWATVVGVVGVVVGAVGAVKHFTSRSSCNNVIS